MTEPAPASRAVLVTGGSRGIGRALVERFARAGDRVLFSYVHDDDAARRTAERAQGHVEAVRLDLSAAEGPDELLAAATARLGALDVLVNNAAIYPHAAFAATPTSLLREVLELNLVAPYRLTQAFAALPADGHARAVVNVTSINARTPDAGLSAYDASKAALEQATRCTALELGPQGIRVNAVAPGLVDGPGVEDAVPERVRAFRSHAPLARLVAPEEVADAVFFLASAQASAITGHTLVVDAGVSLAGYTAAARPDVVS